MGVGRVERRVYAWFIGVVTVSGGLTGGLALLALGSIGFDPPWAFALVLGDLAVLIGGLWLAVRVGTGRFSRAGWVVTGGLAAMVGVTGIVLSAIGASRGVTEGFRLALCLALGLLVAFGLALVVRARRYTPEGHGPDLQGRTRHVFEPGTDLTDSPGGTKVARLPGGTRVVELEGQGNHIKVTTRDGRTGWLDRHSVGAASG
jgi:hypothetical protein